MNMLRIVMLTLICISICCAFAGDSYQESILNLVMNYAKARQAVVIARQNIVGTVTFTDEKKVAYNHSDPAF